MACLSKTLLVALTSTAAVMATDVMQRVSNPTQDENMNGHYELSKTPNAPGDFPTDFKNYPGGVEYFDVYHGPITSLYSEVWWTSTSNDLPAEIVKRFDGKVMAIVGMETDQVRKTPEGDVSVPISIAYNHHHDTAVVGKKTHLEEIPMDHSDPRLKKAGRDYIRLSGQKAWIAVDDEEAQSGAKNSAMFSDGNGGEYRKTLHSHSPPYAYLVDSPVTLAGSPMQIDTWNRDKMNLTGSAFVPGPVPKLSLAPQSGPDAIYSGLLECPLTTKIQKIFDGSPGFNDTYEPAVFECDAHQAGSCTHNVGVTTDCFQAAQQLPQFVNKTLHTKTLSNSSFPPGCSISMVDGVPTAIFNSDNMSTTCCGTNGGAMAGIVDNSLVLINISINPSGNVSITLTGPSDVWFGVGFGATLMAETPNAIIVDGKGVVTERTLANHAAGSQIPTSVAILSNTVIKGKRTVVMTRTIKGATSAHYTFDAMKLKLDLINAIGSGPDFAYHKMSNAVTMDLWPASEDASVCVCTMPADPFGQGSGKIKYLPTGETVGFQAGRCAPQPREDILVQRNPTCDLRAYAGGLATCHHGWSLLDAEQEQPWPNQTLVYYKKFRIYFQEYNASFHKQLSRTDWGIAADGDHAEYDVPQCAPGTPTSECTHLITGTWMPVPASDSNMHLIGAHFHCHAPTCLRMELWNNDTGTILCRQEPIYGGTGKIDQSRFDEPGYIATPPCLWGDSQFGLEAPPLVSGVTIKVTALTNNTYGHHGEMALPEVTLVKLD